MNVHTKTSLPVLEKVVIELNSHEARELEHFLQAHGTGNGHVVLELRCLLSDLRRKLEF